MRRHCGRKTFTTAVEKTHTDYKMKEKKNKMQTIQVTLEEIKAATRPNVYRNKKKYTRKTKHKNMQD